VRALPGNPWIEVAAGRVDGILSALGLTKNEKGGSLRRIAAICSAKLI